MLDMGSYFATLPMMVCMLIFHERNDVHKPKRFICRAEGPRMNYHQMPISCPCHAPHECLIFPHACLMSSHEPLVAVSFALVSALCLA